MWLKLNCERNVTVAYIIAKSSVFQIFFGLVTNTSVITYCISRKGIGAFY